ncbi:MAG: hypothetical protein K8U03_06890 [Planctomycetia bacterium]|nr:hypothetical protein [Planctomycetia bacterium]
MAFRNSRRDRAELLYGTLHGPQLDGDARQAVVDQNDPVQLTLDARGNLRGNMAELFDHDEQRLAAVDSPFRSSGRDTAGGAPTSDRHATIELMRSTGMPVPKMEWNYETNRATPVAPRNDAGQRPLTTLELMRSTGMPIPAATLTGNHAILDGMLGDQARREREAANYKHALPQFMGGNTAAPLDAETEQRLADMRQPISNSGPDFDPNGARMTNLRASQRPPTAPSTPLPASADLLDEIRRKREADAAATLERRLNMPTEQRDRIQQQEADIKARGRAVNDQGRQMQEQNARADANVTNQAMAERLVRAHAAVGQRLSPTQARLMIESGMVGPAMRDPSAPTRQASVDPMSTPGFAANFPGQYATHAAATTQRDIAKQNNALATANADFERRKAIADLHGGWAAREILHLKEEKATALPARQAEIDRKIREIEQQAIVRAIETMNGGTMSPGQPSTGLPLTPASLSLPSQQSSGTGPTIDPGKISRFPVAKNAAENAAEIAAAAGNFQPSFPDLAPASGWDDSRLLEVTAQDHKPRVPWNDKNKDGVPQTDEVANENDLRYYLGQVHTKPILDKMLKDAKNANTVTGPELPGTMYRYLKNKFGNQYGEDAVRWVMAQHYGRPEWITDYGTYRDAFLAPKKPAGNEPRMVLGMPGSFVP